MNNNSPMFESEKYCKNCGQHLILDQKFCHNCGQKADTHRIDYHFLIHEIQHSVFHVDKGIFFTIKELFTRPGHTIREYLDGRRQNHFKPVLFLIIAGSVCGLLNYFTSDGRGIGGAQRDFENTVGDPKVLQYVDIDGLANFFKNVFFWFSDHFSFFILFMIPAAAFGFYRGFRKYKLNYAEWLVIITFLSGQMLVVYFFVLLFEYLSGRDASTFFLLVTMGLTTWTMVQLFRHRPALRMILRTLWSYLLSWIFTGIHIVITALVLFLVGIVIFGKHKIIEDLQKPEPKTEIIQSPAQN